MIKAFRLIVMFVLAAMAGMAQQSAQYTQYMFNNYGINPASGGATQCIEARLGYRNQWVGFDGGPIEQFVSVNGIIRKDRDSPGKHAVGGYVERDVTGPISRIGIYASYAHHFLVTERAHLALGAFFGTTQYNYDRSGMQLGDPNDPVVYSGGDTKFLYPDVTPAAFYYTKNFYSGISVKNVFVNDLDGVQGQNGNLVPHALYTVGARKLSKSRKFSYHPYALVKIGVLTPPAIDANLFVDYRNIFGLGVGYRHMDCVNFMMRIGIGKQVHISYSYDVTLSSIRIASRNTHEFLLAYRLCRGGYKDVKICPAYE